MSRAWSRRLRLLSMAVALALLSSSALAQIASTDGNSLTVAISGTEVARFVPNDISSSGVVHVSGSTLTCSSAIKGAIRYSNTSSTLEYCNSTAWTSLGPSATTVPSFRVHRNGTGQTGLTAAAWEGSQCARPGACT